MTKVTVDLADALRTIPYLAGLDRAQRAALAARCVVRAVPRAGVVFEEGHPATGVFVVLAGRIKLVRLSARGREQVLHVESAGSTLAEVPVFDGGGYVATAIALESARLLFVPRAALLDLCRRRPDVALGVIAALARRVRVFAALIEDLALRDVTARVARLLAAEATRRGDTFDLPDTRDELGARLGTVRERVSRSLSALRAAGLITVLSRRVQVLERARLAALGSGE
jgi:CRP/FNR family transcriptional regulator